MKILAMSAAILVAALGANAALAEPGDPPYPSEQFLRIDRYYDDLNPFQPPELTGWDITYCDFSIESYRKPGGNQTLIETEEGSCL